MALTTWRLSVFWRRIPSSLLKLRFTTRNHACGCRRLAVGSSLQSKVTEYDRDAATMFTSVLTLSTELYQRVNVTLPDPKSPHQLHCRRYLMSVTQYLHSSSNQNGCAITRSIPSLASGSKAVIPEIIRSASGPSSSPQRSNLSPGSSFTISSAIFAAPSRAADQSPSPAIPKIALGTGPKWQKCRAKISCSGVIPRATSSW